MRKPREGTLVVVEGTRGVDVEAGVARLSERLKRRVPPITVAPWNASRSFKRLRPDRLVHPPAARTLLLLYAADLAFRWQREIAPALRSGRAVIAAPYVHTAIGFGRAVGLPDTWLREVFRFAPTPDLCYCVKERKKSNPWSGQAKEGFLEFCNASLDGALPSWNPVAARRETMEYLEELVEKGRCARV
jgi:hypothetical protein